MKILAPIFLLLLFSCNPDPPGKDDSTAGKKVKVKEEMNFSYFSAVAYATTSAFELELIHIGDTIDTNSTKHVFRKLSLDDLAVLREAVNSEEEDGPRADCFNPRHNVLFLDSSGKVVQYIDVCFECGQSKASQPGLTGKLSLFETFFNHIGLPVLWTPDEHAHYYDSVSKAERPVEVSPQPAPSTTTAVTNNPQPSPELLKAIEKWKQSRSGTGNGFVDTSLPAGSPGGGSSAVTAQGGRRIVSRPEIKNPTQEEGKVVVNVFIDRAGVVRKAEVSEAGTNTLNATLRATATQSCYQIRFSVDPSGPELLKLPVSIIFSLP